MPHKQETNAAPQLHHHSSNSSAQTVPSTAPTRSVSVSFPSFPCSYLYWIPLFYARYFFMCLCIYFNSLREVIYRSLLFVLVLQLGTSRLDGTLL
ncbi:hypothetical protein BDQ12DRAFT_676033 [Crucibulum laeve]|uniref:Uncharacterized protein n=1 Tax=Crucibulum laeve TaxID=68775 RepID=A0A5C3MA84_9AGAR|nr:hypothetical protein BDQ12DRAFT_676033 [Crucibulum laeve]